MSAGEAVRLDAPTRVQPIARRTGRRVFAPVGVLTALLAAAAVALFVGAGSAAAQTVSAQLSLTGVATASSPTGGSQVGVHPGDSVTFSAASAPTAGLNSLGLSSILPGVLSGGSSAVASVQMRADFSGLPGGASDTVLSGGATRTFRFDRAGTYTFTWTAEQVQVLPLLGTKITTIALDGNSLAQAGVKLNAGNQYVGQVVVAANPPQGGLSAQLPTTQVSPQVGGQRLPTVSVPGATAPTAAAQPAGGSASSASSGAGAAAGSGAGSGATAASSAPTSALPVFTAPALTVPQQVVPGSGVVIGDTSGGGGVRLGVAQGSDNGALAVGTSGATSEADGVHLASQNSATADQLPVLLAILAVLALAVVAGTYARIFLLGHGAARRPAAAASPAPAKRRPSPQA